MSIFGYTKHQNLTNGSWIWVHKEFLREYSAAYYKANREKKCEQSAQYYQDHREIVLKQVSDHYFRNREEKIKYGVAYNKQYQKNHKESFKKWRKKYYQSVNGKVKHQKMMAKRRKKGFEKIACFKDNKIQSPTHFHHIDNNYVIEIPAWLHYKCNAGRHVLKHLSDVKQMI